MTYIPNNSNCNGGGGGTGGTGSTGCNTNCPKTSTNIIFVCCNKKLPSILDGYNINIENIPSGYTNCGCNNYDPSCNIGTDPFNYYLMQKEKERNERNNKFILIFVVACCIVVVINTFVISFKISDLAGMGLQKKFNLLDLFF